MELMRPTLMIDEADLLRHSRDLKAVLNAGVERGRLITRAAPKGGVFTYDPFGPKMLAGIYGTEPPLKGATLSRCIQIGLRRRHPGTETVEDFDKDVAEDESAGMREALRGWAMAADRDALSRAKPAVPAELTDRQRDAWRPLVVVADLIGPASARPPGLGSPAAQAAPPPARLWCRLTCPSVRPRTAPARSRRSGAGRAPGAVAR
jgi:hypothetical protein